MDILAALERDNKGTKTLEERLRLAKNIIPSTELPLLYEDNFGKWYTTLNIFLLNEMKKRYGNHPQVTRLIAVFLLTNSVRSKIGLMQYISKNIFDDDMTISVIRFWKKEILVTSRDYMELGYLIFYRIRTVESLTENLTREQLVHVAGSYMEKVRQLGHTSGDHTVNVGIFLTNLMSFNNKTESLLDISRRKIYGKVNVVRDILVDLLSFYHNYLDLGVIYNSIAMHSITGKNDKDTYDTVEGLISKMQKTKKYTCNELFDWLITEDTEKRVAFYTYMAIEKICEKKLHNEYVIYKLTKLGLTDIIEWINFDNDMIQW